MLTVPSADCADEVPQMEKVYDLFPVLACRVVRAGGLLTRCCTSPSSARALSAATSNPFADDRDHLPENVYVPEGKDMEHQGICQALTKPAVEGHICFDCPGHARKLPCPTGTEVSLLTRNAA